MQRNGKTVCDICNLFIFPLQKSVRVQRAETSGGDPNDFAHFHARDSTDCFYREYEKAKALATKKPTADDVSQYQAFLKASATGAR